MTDQDSVYSGGFRKLYLVVKALALYAGTFFLAYFWPQFLGFVIPGGDGLPTEMIAIFLVVPAGFLVLGVSQGKGTALVHVGLLVAAGVLAFVFLPKDLGDWRDTALPFWTSAMLGVFAVGAAFGVRRQLQKF